MVSSSFRITRNQSLTQSSCASQYAFDMRHLSMPPDSLITIDFSIKTDTQELLQQLFCRVSQQILKRDFLVDDSPSIASSDAKGGNKHKLPGFMHREYTADGLETVA